MDVTRIVFTGVTLVLVTILVLLTAARLARTALRAPRLPTGKRRRFAIQEAMPSVPVVRSGSLRLVMGLVLAWSLLHLGVIGAWLATGIGVERELSWVLAAGYGVLAAVLTGSGAVQALRCRPIGRKMVAWGLFLFGLLVFFLGIVFLIVPSDPRLPERLRQAAYPLAGLFAAHLLTDLVLGVAAQHAGRPKGWRDQPETPADWNRPEFGPSQPDD